jgi:PAS domain S-box-containing protein
MPEELGPDETQILAAMLGISEMVGGLSDLQELLGTVVRIVPQLVRGNRCAIFSLDRKRGELKCEQAFGPDMGQIKYISGLVIKEADIPKLAQKVIKQRLPALIRDAFKEEILPAAVIQRLGLKAMLIVPLVCRESVLGIMFLDDSSGSRYFTSKEINVVIGIATITAIAIDSTTSREELATEKARLAALAAATSTAFLVLDPHFRIKYVNSLGEEMLGWKREELVGKLCSEVLRATDTNGVNVCGSSCIGQRLLWGEDAAGEVHRLSFQTKDGRRMLCDVRGSAVRNPKGDITEIVYALIRTKPSVTPIPMREHAPIEGIDELKEIVLGSK